MHNAAGGSLHRRVYSSIKSSALSRWQVEQPGAADRGRKWCINQKSRGFLYITTDTIVSSYHRKLSWHLPPQRGGGGDPLLCSHINFSWISTDVILGGQADEVCRNYAGSHSDICVPTCTSSRENTEEQYMSESSSSDSLLCLFHYVLIMKQWWLL